MKDLIPIVERALYLSGQPETSQGVQKRLVEEAADLGEYVDPRASVSATIQRVLELLPSSRVQKLVRPGGETRFQWIYRADFASMD